MTKSEIEKIMEVAENLDISAYENIDDIDFEYYTEYGQDFCFTIDKAENLHNFASNVYAYWQNYDVDEEAALWIGSDGHGKNGAPYYISQILANMQECEDLLKKLWYKLYDKAVCIV